MMVLNGVIGGLVLIMVEFFVLFILLVVVIGVIGGILVVIFVLLFDRLRIDDVVGVILVYLVCGIWGMMVVFLFNGDVIFYG